MVRTMFEASTSVQIGDGRQTLFWLVKWVDGRSIKAMAPQLFLTVSKRVVMTWRVSDVLLDVCWIRGITGSLSVLALHQYVSLWSRIQHIHLDHALPDKFI
jgi:hypothetical protein